MTRGFVDRIRAHAGECVEKTERRCVQRLPLSLPTVVDTGMQLLTDVRRTGD